MKTSISLPIQLHARARRLAQREGITMNALIEEGLLQVLHLRAEKSATTFRINPFVGDGLTPEFQNAAWGVFRDESHRRPASA